MKKQIKETFNIRPDAMLFAALMTGFIAISTAVIVFLLLQVNTPLAIAAGGFWLLATMALAKQVVTLRELKKSKRNDV